MGAVHVETVRPLHGGVLRVNKVLGERVGAGASLAHALDFGSGFRHALHEHRNGQGAPCLSSEELLKKHVAYAPKSSQE
jgi:hypothetical protein